MRNGPRAAARRRLALSLLALLLVVAALLGSFAWRRHPPEQPHPSWVPLAPTDPRVAPAFRALERDGLAAALDTLERLARDDSLVLRGGHQLAHALGRQALVDNGGDSSVLGHCRPVFASGCYHGVIEAYLNARGRIDMSELERMCTAVGDRERPGPIYECVHGLGHGVLGALALDVPAALRHCDALSTAAFAASCHQGVFMEAITSAVAVGAGAANVHASEGHAGHHDGPAGRLTLDPRDPYSPCDRFGDPYGESCWLFQGYLILRSDGFDPAKALRTCDAAPAGRAGRCYESVGHQLMGLFQRGDAWIVQQCAKGRPELAPRCAAGAALALAGADWSGDRAVALCSSVPGGWKETCYRAAAGLIAQLESASRRGALCAAVEPAYVHACRQEAGLEG